MSTENLSAQPGPLIDKIRSLPEMGDTQSAKADLVKSELATSKKEFQEVAKKAVEDGVDGDGNYLRGLIIAGISGHERDDSLNQVGLVGEVRRVYSQAQISAALINEPTEANKLLSNLQMMYRQVGQEYQPKIEVSKSVTAAERETLIAAELRQAFREFPNRAADLLMNGWYELRAEEAVLKESLDREAKKPIGDISVTQISAQVRSLRAKEARMDRFGVQVFSDLGKEPTMWYAMRATSSEPTTQPMAAISDLNSEEQRQAVQGRIRKYEDGELSDHNDVVALKMLPQADRNRVVASVLDAERRIISNKVLLEEGIRIGNPEVIANTAIKLKILEQQRRSQDAELKAWVASQRADNSRERFADALLREGAWLTEGVTGFKEKVGNIWDSAKEVAEAHKKSVVNKAKVARFNSKIINRVEDFIDAARDVPFQRAIGELDDIFLSGIRETADTTATAIRGRIVESEAKIYRFLAERDVRKINERREYYTKRHEARVRRDMGLIKPERRDVNSDTASDEKWADWIQTLVEDVQYTEKAKQKEQSSEFVEMVSTNPDFAYFSKKLESMIQFTALSEPKAQVVSKEPKIRLPEPPQALASSAGDMASNILRRAGLAAVQPKEDQKIGITKPDSKTNRGPSLTEERFKALENASVEDLDRWIARDQRYLNRWLGEPEDKRPSDFEEKRKLAESYLEMNRKALERRRAK